MTRARLLLVLAVHGCGLWNALTLVANLDAARWGYAAVSAVMMLWLARCLTFLSPKGRL